MKIHVNKNVCRQVALVGQVTVFGETSHINFVLLQGKSPSFSTGDCGEYPVFKAEVGLFKRLMYPLIKLKKKWNLTYLCRRTIQWCLHTKWLPKKGLEKEHRP